MPMWPTRLRMSRVRNTSRTRPGPLCMWKLWPSAVTMPAASCPRCCSTVMPSYSSWFTGLRATTPTIPHIARLPSRKRIHGGRDGRLRGPSWQGHDLAVERCALQLGERGFGLVPRLERSRAQAREPAALGVEPLGVMGHAGGGELVALDLELGFVAEGAHLDGKAAAGRLGDWRGRRGG